MEINDTGNQDAFVNSPDADKVTEFWSFARDRVGWATLEGIFGQQQASSVEPPWMHLGDTIRESDAELEQLLAEGTLVLASPLDVYPEDGDLPQRGDLAIVCTGHGRPTALVATLEVRVSQGTDGAGRIVEEKLRCLYPSVG